MFNLSISKFDKKIVSLILLAFFLGIFTFFPAKTNAQAPNVNLTASPSYITSGQSSTLRWTVTGAVSCIAEPAPNWSGPRSTTSGTESTGAINLPYNWSTGSSSFVWQLHCTSSSGERKGVSAVVYASHPTPVITLSASPSTVPSGGGTTLSWSVSRHNYSYSGNKSTASSCTASGGWSGSKSVDGGSQSVSGLTSPTTFTITCTGNGGGTVSRSVTINVSAQAPTISFYASPASVVSGNGTYLYWSTSNATSCSASGSWSGSKSTSGNHYTGSLTSGRTYSITCSGPGGSTSRSVTVGVTTPPPTVSLTASPSSISYGNSSTLYWSTSNATSCTASNSWSGSKVATGGSQSTGALTSSRTYSISCSGPGGTSSDSVTVSVSYALPTVSLSINPLSVVYGDSATLTWSTSNATSCSAFDGWSGNKAASGGSQNTGALTENTSFRLVCTGPGGSSQSAVLATVITGSGASLTSDKELFSHLVRPNGIITLTYNVGTSAPGTCTIRKGGIAIYSINNSSGTFQDRVEGGEVIYTLDCPGNQSSIKVRTLPEFQET